MGRGTAATVGALVVAALCAACAGSADPGAAPTGSGAETTAPTATGSTPPEPESTSRVPTVAETTFAGAPDGVSAEDVAVAAHEDPRKLQLVTVGSSSCPVLPAAVTWDAAAQVLEITLNGPEVYADAMCTADLAPTTSVVALPDEAPDAPGLAVEVDGRELAVG